MQVRVRAVKRVNPKFSGDMINIIRKPAEIQRAYDEITAGNKKGGCIVIRNALVESAGVLKELGIPVMATPRGGALRRMAIFRRERYDGPVICVTGTAGKTSVRGMIYEIAKSQFKTVQNRGNWNFRDHVFENIASMPIDTKCAVLEIGLGQKNVRLSDVVSVLKPSISVVTSIGVGHMDAIGSTSEVEDELESAFKAKMEVVDHMADDSFAVVASDITMSKEVISILKNKVSSYKTVGGQPLDSVKMLEREWKDGKNRLLVESNGTQYRYDLAAPGEHMAKNSLIAICVAEKLGISMEKTLANLKKFTPRPGRAKLIDLESRSGKKVVIFDDSRNSTPLSLASSLVTFEEIAKDKNKVAILGEVGEFHVGKDMEGFHRNLAKEIKEKEFKKSSRDGRFNEIFR